MREHSIRLFISQYTEVYSDQFSEVGIFIIDDVFLVANHPETDPSLVTVIKAHSKDKPTFRVEATSDKFTFK